MNKTKRIGRVEIALGTLKSVAQGCYTLPSGENVLLTDQIKSCIENTQLYTPEMLTALKSSEPLTSHCTIELVNETSLQGAQRLVGTGHFQRVMVLNFASAKNAGGGFKGGSQAQEESLARSSALYESLTHCREYYDYHRKHRSLLYSDHMIYSPDCPVFRLDSGEYLPRPYCVDFITSPASNRGAIARSESKSLLHLEAVFRQRIKYMLTLAADRGCDALVLGAWGCGVFANIPEQVAALFAEQLLHDGEFAQAFRHVSFSIPENSRSAVNVVAFAKYFANV